MSSDPFEMQEEFEDDVDLSPQNKAPSSRVERFKGDQGRTYRVALLYFHPLSISIARQMKKAAEQDDKEINKAAVKKAIQEAYKKRAEEWGKDSVEELEDWEKLDIDHAQFRKYDKQFKSGVGSFVSRLGKDGPEYDKYWRQLEDKRTYYSTAIVVYSTDRKGAVDKGDLFKGSTVAPFRCSPSTFNRLIEINESLNELSNGERSLATQDLKLTCKNGQYQQFDIDPMGEAIWRKSDKFRNLYLPQAYALYDHLIDARVISSQELKVKLGGGDSGQDVEDVGDIDDSLEGL